MKSLFLRIFAWFWLASSLAGIAVLVVTWSMRAEPFMPQQQGLVSDAVRRAARECAEKFAQSGAAATQRHLAAWESTTKVEAYFFDGSGRLLAGDEQEETAAARAMAQRPLAGGAVDYQMQGARVLSATRTAGPDGRDYVLVTAIDRSIGQAFNIRPAGRVLRILSMVLIAGPFCYGLAKYLADPILKLRNATKQVAAGDLSVRVAPQLKRRNDELMELARDFDAMAERVAALLSAQRRLLGDISHELRTPLTRMNLALELARRSAGADAGPALDRIERESAQLNELIGQLLALSRLEAGDAAPLVTLVDLPQMVRQVASDAELEAKSRECSLAIGELPHCLVQGTPAVLRSAIENVVRNGLRHTPGGTSVEIGLRCDERVAIIQVRDHGPGVPEETLVDIFQPFFRVDEARNRQDGGTGLGLAIVERAVTSHGGTVQAHNAPGGGLVVELHLPLHVA